MGNRIRRVCGLLLAMGLVVGFAACTCQETPPPAPAASGSPAAEDSPYAEGKDAQLLGQIPLPPPRDPEARDAWLKEISEKMPPVPTLFTIGPEGAGAFGACMSEDALRAMAGVRLCPDTGLTTRERCYTTFRNTTREDLPLELWVRDGYLSRAISRSSQFQSPHRVGVGSKYVDLMATYANPHYLRGDKGEWVVVVPALQTQFFLNDTTSASAEGIDALAEIVRMEAVFDCR